ncbi:hypothetical protein BpHYR1_019911 [Brachionus plicatilis]|uniref:Uncharacterized protein n=1 Tax=Brachionus plicatilis TaxID=10195 RepID=A0A3M7PT38_BRAPC|nr:hypothetical protein BpHYR1_019911 [Brachionus plicatilis]
MDINLNFSESTSNELIQFLSEQPKVDFSVVRPIRQSHFRQVTSDKSRSDNAFSDKIISDKF